VVFVPLSTATDVAAGLASGGALSLWWELVCLLLWELLEVLEVCVAPCPPVDA
jgi:hypothetical protein